MRARASEGQGWEIIKLRCGKRKREENTEEGAKKWWGTN
jgi:hypothetical protein